MIKTFSKFMLTLLLLPLGCLVSLVVITAFILVLPATMLFTADYLANFLSSKLHDEPIDEIHAKPFSLEKFIFIGLTLIPAIIVCSVFTVIGTPIFLVLCTASFSYRSSELFVDKAFDYFANVEVFAEDHKNAALSQLQPNEGPVRKAVQAYSTYDLSIFKKPVEEVSDEVIDVTMRPELSNQIKLNFLHSRTNPNKDIGQGTWSNLPSLN